MDSARRKQLPFLSEREPQLWVIQAGVLLLKTLIKGNQLFNSLRQINFPFAHLIVSKSTCDLYSPTTPLLISPCGIRFLYQPYCEGFTPLTEYKRPLRDDFSISQGLKLCYSVIENQLAFLEKEGAGIQLVIKGNQLFNSLRQINFPFAHPIVSKST